jgi:hypothetical protein
MIWCWGLCRWYFTALHRKETRSPNGWLSRKIRALRFVREPILRSAFASWWQTPCCTRTFACGANTLAGAACAAVDRAVVSRPCADWEIERWHRKSALQIFNCAGFGLMAIVNHERLGIHRSALAVFEGRPARKYAATDRSACRLRIYLKQLPHITRFLLCDCIGSLAEGRRR